MKNNKISFVQTIKIMVRSFSFIGKERNKYLLGWVLSFGEIIMIFVTPFIYEKLANMVNNYFSENEFYILFVMFGVFLVITPLICIGTYLRNTTAYYGASLLKKQLFSHIQNLSISEFNEYKTGDYISRLSTDASRTVGMFSSSPFTGLVKFIVYLIVGTFLLIQIQWKLAVISTLLCFISIFFTVLFNPKVRALENSARKAAASSITHIIETLVATPVVRIFLLQNVLSNNYFKSCKNIYDKKVSFNLWSGYTYATLNFFGYITQPLCFGFAIYLATKGTLNISQVVFAAFVTDIIAKAAMEANTFIQYIQPSLVSAQRVFEILDKPVEVNISGQNPCIKSNSENALEFKQVSFSYPNGTTVLKDISFNVKKGETIAIVGGSGSGKSTLCRLILGIYKPQKGKINYFGKSINELNISDIRGEIAYVSQDCTLFDCSIFENIALGKDNATEEEVIMAAKEANIHDFIISNVDKYKLLVGDRGTQLSGGQRQRIAIARAVLKNGSILLFDEATSALDPETEAQINENIACISKNKTTIVVTHRLNTIKNADKILVIENGEIVEEGTHNKLITSGGKYKKLYEMHLTA